MPCERTNCQYHTEKNNANGCNYIFVVGISKLGQMPPNEKYSIENCPFYKKGKRRSALKSTQMPTPNPIEVLRQVDSLDGDEVEKLYDANLCDRDIALLMGVSVQAIAKWRRRKGIIRSMAKSGSIRKINWDEVKIMFDEGYSDIAVAMYVKVPLEVIQRYKDILIRKNSEGGDGIGLSKNSL